MSLGTLVSLGTIPARGMLFTLLTVTLVTPVAAQSREQRQMMADLRMLQEQNQTLQNVLGSIIEAIKAVSTRIDDQAKATGKAMADEKLVIDNLTNNVREIREKLDDNSVRLGSLNQEVEALRQGLQQLNARPAAPDTTASEAPGGAGGSAPRSGSRCRGRAWASRSPPSLLSLLTSTTLSPRRPFLL